MASMNETEWRQRKRKSEEEGKKSVSEVVQKRKTSSQGKINDFFQRRDQNAASEMLEEPPDMEPLLSQAYEYDGAKIDDEVCPATNKMARTKTLQDRMYGQMTFDNILALIMDTPEFQRLGALKQLGVSDLVYRTATHTRLEHSCGVVYLADRLMDRFVIQRIKDKRLRRSTFRCDDWWNKGDGQGADCALCTDENGETKTIIAKITDADRLCVLIAALCHDLGHGPYSHMFEHVVKHMASEQARPKHKRWTHEQMSVLMLRHLLKENNIDLAAHGLDPENDLRFIEELILGGDLEGGVKERRGRGPEKEFLYDIVNNAHSGLDVDKLDYFMRDMQATLGEQNCFPRRFVDLAKVAWVPGKEGRAGRWEMCWPTKMAQEAPKLFNIRYRMHQAVYQHRKVKCFEHLVSEILVKVVQEPLVNVVDEGGAVVRRFSIEEAIWDPKAFLHLTDDILTIIFHAQPGSDGFRDPAKMREAKQLYLRLKRRETWRFVGCTQVEIADDRTEEEADEYNERVKSEILAHVRSVERGDERQEEMHTIPETPPDVVEVEEEAEEEEIQLSQKETPQKLRPRSSSGASKGVAGQRQRSSSSSSNSQRERQVTLGKDDLVVEVVSIHHGKKSKDPVARMNFFSKTAEETGVWKAGSVDPRNYASAMPRMLQSHEMRVLVSNDAKLELAIKCHKAWCKAHNHPEPISMLSQDESDSMSSMAG